MFEIASLENDVTTDWLSDELQELLELLFATKNQSNSQYIEITWTTGYRSMLLPAKGILRYQSCDLQQFLLNCFLYWLDRNL